MRVKALLFICLLMLVGCSSGAIWSNYSTSPKGFSDEVEGHYYASVGVIWKGYSYDDVGKKRIRIYIADYSLNEHGLRKGEIHYEEFDITAGKVRVDYTWNQDTLTILISDNAENPPIKKSFVIVDGTAQSVTP